MHQTTAAQPERPRPADAAPDDTAEITKAIARGDTRAFGLLYERWFDSAYAAARRLTGRDEAFCLDIVQDTMLKAARRVPRLPTEAALAAWLGKALHRTALDHLRAERRRVARERRPRHGDPIGAAHEQLTERLAWLRTQIRELPPQEQSLLAARFARERTLAQAGQDHGLSADAAHGRIRRALRTLQQAGEAGERGDAP